MVVREPPRPGASHRGHLLLGLHASAVPPRLTPCLGTLWPLEVAYLGLGLPSQAPAVDPGQATWVSFLTVAVTRWCGPVLRWTRHSVSSPGPASLGPLGAGVQPASWGSLREAPGKGLHRQPLPREDPGSSVSPGLPRLLRASVAAPGWLRPRPEVARRRGARPSGTGAICM